MDHKGFAVTIYRQHAAGFPVCQKQIHCLKAVQDRNALFLHFLPQCPQDGLEVVFHHMGAGFFGETGLIDPEVPVRLAENLPAADVLQIPEGVLCLPGEDFTKRKAGRPKGRVLHILIKGLRAVGGIHGPVRHVEGADFRHTIIGCATTPGLALGDQRGGCPAPAGAEGCPQGGPAAADDNNIKP